MFQVAAISIIIAAVMVLYRALRGPTVYNRILAVNVIGTKTVIVLVLVGFIYGRPDFLDISLIYALINFTAVLAFLKYMEAGKLDK